MTVLRVSQVQAVMRRREQLSRAALKMRNRRLRGPVERQLRAGWATWEWCCSTATQEVWWELCEAAQRLGFASLTEAAPKYLADVLSEAIEAAEALGL